MDIVIDKVGASSDATEDAAKLECVRSESYVRSKSYVRPILLQIVTRSAVVARWPSTGVSSLL